MRFAEVNMRDLYSEDDVGKEAIVLVNQRVLQDFRRICEDGMESIRLRNAREEPYSAKTPYDK